MYAIYSRWVRSSFLSRFLELNSSSFVSKHIISYISTPVRFCCVRVELKRLDESMWSRCARPISARVQQRDALLSGSVCGNGGDWRCLSSPSLWTLLFFCCVWVCAVSAGRWSSASGEHLYNITITERKCHFNLLFQFSQSLEQRTTGKTIIYRLRKYNYFSNYTILCTKMLVFLYVGSIYHKSNGL